MNHLHKVLGFAWPFFRRYWIRLFAGILLGVLFGMSNASFIWATKSLIERLDPVQKPAVTPAAIGASGAAAAAAAWAAPHPLAAAATGAVLGSNPSPPLPAGTLEAL